MAEPPCPGGSPVGLLPEPLKCGSRAPAAFQERAMNLFQHAACAARGRDVAAGAEAVGGDGTAPCLIGAPVSAAGEHVLKEVR